MDIEDSILNDLMIMVGEKKKSPAVSKAIREFVQRQKARDFGKLLREGTFDYPLTNEEIEQQDTSNSAQSEG